MKHHSYDLTSILEKCSSISELQEEFRIYQAKAFTAKSAEFFCLELNGEAGELANIEKKKWKGREIDHHQFEDEAADVLIALMNYANARGVDLAVATRKKLKTIEENRTRLAADGKQY